jgi:hypothetical protein
MRYIVPLLLALAPVPALAAPSADRMSYVLMSGDGNSSSMMNGSSDDLRLAKSLRAGNAPMLYVREGGSAYVIRDAAFLRRADAIMKPQRDLGARQGELGQQQGELGRRQGTLGAEQGRLGRLMADTTLRRMGALGTQMAELGRRQSDLGKQQAALGSRQAALGREQARLAEQAKPQFRALVADAIRRGLAQRVD